MRKKSYFTLALFGAILGLGAFSSCKDNAEEIYHDLRADNEAQKQALLTDVNQMISDAFKNNACKDACKCFETWKDYMGDKADVNGDGKVDINDFYDWILKDDDETFNQWLALMGDADKDINGDGKVDVNDMFAYLLNCDDQACKDAADLATEIYKALMETEDGLSTDPEKRAEQLKAYRERVIQLVNDLKEMREVYTELVTNVQVNATENALVGYLNTPFGLSSKTLFAFYGVSKNTLNFPATSASSTGYIDAEEALTQSEIDMFKDKVSAFAIASDEIVVASEEGNAGTVYLTLNPNSVDFTGKEVNLVNSQNEASDIELSNLTKSDKVLQFGYTRADNHFLYEAAATVKATAIDGGNVNKIEWNKEELKQTAKDLVSAVRNRSISEIASFVYDKLNPELDAYGIQTSYRGLSMVDDKAVLDENTTVVSNYEIAAAAIKAPSLMLVKEVQDKLSNRTKVPGYNRVHNMIDRMAKKLHFSLPNFAIKDLNIDHVELKTFVVTDEQVKEFKVELATVLEVNGLQYYVAYSDEKGWGVYDKTDGNKRVNDIRLKEEDATKIAAGTYTEKTVQAFITFDLRDAIKDIMVDVYGDATAPINDVNKMIDDINDYLADVNEALAQLNDLESKINGQVNSAFKEVYRVLDRFNSLATRAMGHIDYLVKPALLFNGKDGVKMLSRSKYLPSAITADADFIATSMSAEVLVPFAKKHVAVVNVFDAAGNVAADAQAKAAAVKGLNEVVDGGVNTVATSGFEAGYIYELAYSVVDYAGYVSTRRFFVTIK